MRRELSCDSRAASTAPAEPPPTMMSSYSTGGTSCVLPCRSRDHGFEIIASAAERTPVARARILCSGLTDDFAPVLIDTPRCTESGLCSTQGGTVIGPFDTIDLGGGRTLPLYLLRYGPGGEVLSPQTTQILEDSLGGASDVFLFSHGWNNTFDDAARNYRQFIDGYLSEAHLPTVPGPHTVEQAVLIGVVWPSISFLMPWEDGPVIAADTSAAAAHAEEMRAFVTGDLDPEARARLSELLDGAAPLSPEQAREAAALVLAGLRTEP